MRIIARKRIVEYGRKHPAAHASLERWHGIVKRAEWRSLVEVRKALPNADAVKVDSGRTVTVFNIAGGNFRLLTALHYNHNRAYVLELLTHAEYDAMQWRERL